MPLACRQCVTTHAGRLLCKACTFSPTNGYISAVCRYLRIGTTCKSFTYCEPHLTCDCVLGSMPTCGP